MANNESRTKVEQEEIFKNFDETKLFIGLNPALKDCNFYVKGFGLYVIRSMWGIRTIGELIKICDVNRLSFIIETNERILIFKNN